MTNHPHDYAPLLHARSCEYC